MPLQFLALLWIFSTIAIAFSAAHESLVLLPDVVLVCFFFLMIRSHRRAFNALFEAHRLRMIKFESFKGKVCSPYRDWLTFTGYYTATVVAQEGEPREATCVCTGPFLP